MSQKVIHSRAITLRCRIARRGLVFDQAYLGWPHPLMAHDVDRLADNFMVIVDGIPTKMGAHLFEPVKPEHQRFFKRHATGQAERDTSWIDKLRAACGAGQIMTGRQVPQPAPKPAPKGAAA